MSEWGIPFDYIETHWTDREFMAMVNVHNKRITELNASMKTAKQGPAGSKTMSLRQFRETKLGIKS